jgi:hypothetical protein
MIPLVLTWMLLPALAGAALPDPTAPPAPAAAEGVAAAPAAALTAIKRNGKTRVAVISGQEVAVGGRYEDARVIRITENEVVLRRGGETVVLTLFPHVEKRPRGR